MTTIYCRECKVDAGQFDIKIVAPCVCQNDLKYIHNLCINTKYCIHCKTKFISTHVDTHWIKYIENIALQLVCCAVFTWALSFPKIVMGADLRNNFCYNMMLLIIEYITILGAIEIIQTEQLSTGIIKYTQVYDVMIAIIWIVVSTIYRYLDFSYVWIICIWSILVIYGLRRIYFVNKEIYEDAKDENNLAYSLGVIERDNANDIYETD